MTPDAGQRRWSRALPGVVFGLGALTSVGAWLALDHAEAGERAAHLERDQVEWALRIEGQVLQDIGAVESTGAAFVMGHPEDAAQFRAVTDYLLARHPALRAIGWNPVVSREARASFEATLGGSITEFVDGALVPAGDRAVHYVVQHIEPFAGNEAARGYDIGSEARRLEAVQRGIAERQLALTAPIALVQDERREPGMLAILPHFDDGQVSGLVVGVFQARTFVERALTTRMGDAWLRLEDTTGPPEVLFETPGAPDPRFVRVSRFEVGGRTWQLTTAPTPELIAQHRTMLPMSALLAGLLLTSLAAGLLELLLQRQLHTEARAAERVRELEQREEIERQRRILDNELQQARRLESLGILAGGVAHDFNNLLTIIVGNIALIGDVLPPGSEGREDLDQIAEAAEQAAALVRQMLAYSGRGLREVRPVDLSRLLADLDSVLRASTADAAELAVELTDDLPEIEGDASQLRQVVLGLVSNASEALQGRTGRITVRTGTRTLSQAEVDAAPLAAGAPGLHVFVEIEDTGAGMDAETLQRMFEPFFTTRATGRGLGLAAIQGIVKAHAGTILVDSHPDSGTTITVLLPAGAR